MATPTDRGRNKATDDGLMRRTADLALEYLDSLDDRPVVARAGRDRLLADLGGPLPDDGIDATRVIEDLADAAGPGLVASAGPRYFGFVIGGIPAGGPGRGLADIGLGPERRAVRMRTGRLRRRGGRRVVADRPPGAAARHELRVDHGLPDGQFHMPRGGPTRRPREGRLGCRGAGPLRRAGDRCRGRRGGSCHGPHGSPVPRPRPGPGHTR